MKDKKVIEECKKRWLEKLVEELGDCVLWEFEERGN